MPIVGTVSLENFGDTLEGVHLELTKGIKCLTVPYMQMRIIGYRQDRRGSS
ncbi:hypothetical protein POSPLADRAFT_1062469 [Postia placenta MAD-698-R-SB12]|uniref:Uncharacterized protein n=1 Tax=Postia placenta MAD-698-R-SB12 TaxID=670580 RepID=A0A1X6MJM6_9APHY|nr:hypothetical protein POSPLADRAFT_1062469 [Postia placenta MAD-698-R-SB12]OSX56641.1 hypothetical protein POSPLADRAFT_1062469 [Postia placenta MAD-698-R-SB12]